MKQLREIQQHFTTAMLQRNDTAAAKTIDASENDAKISLSIYRSSIKGIHSDALAAVFPITQQLVGENFFLGLALSYLNKHPSGSGDLHHLGAAMAEFIQTFPAAESLPYLSDVAAMEWAWHVAFHAADPQPFSFNQLATVSTEQQPYIIFNLPPGAALISSDYPLLQIWQAHQPENSVDEIDLNSGACRILIRREGFQVSMETLTVEHWNFLQLIQSGKMLHQIAESIENLDEVLPAAISRHWIAGFSLVQ